MLPYPNQAEVLTRLKENARGFVVFVLNKFNSEHMILSTGSVKMFREISPFIFFFLPINLHLGFLFSSNLNPSR